METNADDMNNLALLQSAEDLLSAWQEACGSNRMPHARFINPVALRKWVGNISVIKLHEGEKRFYVSLHGAHVVRHLGPDFNRKYLEDVIPSAAMHDTLAPYELSIKTKQPTYSIQQASLSNGLFKRLERMILPLSVSDPDKVERFLIWVAPVKSNSTVSPSIFVPFANEEMVGSGESSPQSLSKLYLLSDGHKLDSEVA